MRYRLLAPSLLALSAVALAACGDESMTQPNLRAKPTAEVPELAVAGGSWITRAAPPVERGAFFTATVPNAAGQSVVYVIGGYNESLPLSRVDAYNVATNTWKQRRSMPIALGNQVGSSMDGKIYVAGGINETNLPTTALYVYDPLTNTWTRKRPMPATSAGGASGVIHDKLYVLTGGRFLNHQVVVNFFQYTPSTDRWIRLPNPPEGRYNAGTVLFDKLYVIGDASNGEWDKLVVYDPATNQWTTKAPPPPLGLEAGQAVALRGKMYVIGLQRTDWIVTGGQVRKVTWVYDPGSDTWSYRTEPPEHVFRATRVFVNGQARIEAIGGTNLQYIP